MAKKFAFKQSRGTGCTPQCLGQQSTHKPYTVRAKDGSEYRRNKGHLLKSRTPQYTNEETSENDGKPEASTTSEDRECDNGTESKPTINQRPTANQPAPVMGNEPCTTRSGRVVKPCVIFDLWTDCNDHFQRNLCVNCYSVHFIPCETYGHFIMWHFGNEWTVQLLFNSFCKKGDVMYVYHLALLIIMRASFSVSGRAAIFQSCNSKQSGLRLCFLNGIKLKKYFTESSPEADHISD